MEREFTVRVLIVNTVPYMKNGISSVIFQYYAGLASSKCQFDFVGINDIPLNERKKIESNDGKIFVLPMRNRNPLKYIIGLMKICKSGGYDVIHAHGNSSTLLFEMLAAYLGGVTCRVAHGHSVSCNNHALDRLLKPFFLRSYTVALSCSTEAGKFLFRNRPFTVCVNAFDVESFCFSEESREKSRSEFGLNDKCVIGYVATLSQSKNHIFLLDVFMRYKAINDRAVLLLVGEGPYRERIEEEIQKRNLSESVLLLGERNDIPNLINAFDLVAFPSKFEGLGIALLEAQANGLGVIASKDVIPERVKVNDNFAFVSLDEPEKWLEKMVSMDIRRDKRGCENIKKAGFDIAYQADVLLEIYCQNSLRRNMP